MRYVGKHERSSKGRWVIVCWLFALVFYGISYVYDMQGGSLGWLIWLIFSAVWVYIAAHETIRYLRRDQNR